MKGREGRTEGRERLPRRDRAPRARTRSPLFCFFLSKGGPAFFSFPSLPSLSSPASLCPFFFRGERASLHPSFLRGRGGTCVPSSLHPSGRGNLHPSPSSGRPASLQPSSPSGEPASLHSTGEEPASLSFLREPRIPPPLSPHRSPRRGTCPAASFFTCIPPASGPPRPRCGESSEPRSSETHRLHRPLRASPAERRAGSAGPARLRLVELGSAKLGSAKLGSARTCRRRCPQPLHRGERRAALFIHAFTLPALAAAPHWLGPA